MTMLKLEPLQPFGAVASGIDLRQPLTPQQVKAIERAMDDHAVLIWHDQPLSQDEQIACFQNVAAHLEPGGCFVIEVMIPALQRLPPGETVRPFTVSATRMLAAQKNRVFQSDRPSTANRSITVA